MCQPFADGAESYSRGGWRRSVPRPGSHPAIPLHRRASARAADSGQDAAGDLRAQAFAGAPVRLGIVDSPHRLIEANLALQHLLGEQAAAGARLADLVADGSANAITGVLDALRHVSAGQRTCITTASVAGNQRVVLTLSPLHADAGMQHVLVMVEPDERWSGQDGANERLAALSSSALS